MKTIGVLAEFVTGVFLGELVVALQQAAQTRGVRLLAVRTGELNASYDHPLATGSADGWIVLLNTIGPSMVDKLIASGKPVCSIGYQYENPAAGFVRCDNRAGTLEALETLYALGHRTFAYVGHSHEPDVAERAAALREFLVLHRLDAAPQRFGHSEVYSAMGGHAATERLLAAGVSFTALFCGNDQNALGAIACLREHGLRVPEDVAVVGFDNSPVSRVADNPIATVDQRLPELTACAMDDILARLEDPYRAPANTRVTPHFIPRRSAGVPEEGGAPASVMISRDSALMSLANSDELNRFHHTGDLDSVGPMLARLVPRLRYALVADWDASGQEALAVRFAAPEEVAATQLTGRPIPAAVFPPLELAGIPASAPGELVVVASTDARGGKRSVIAISAAADSFDEFGLALLMHELEVVAIGIERVSAHQQMEREVEARTREVRRVNQDLAQTLTALHLAQRDLVQSEKLAALGRLVAGVAHELNTPLGNSITMTSTLAEEARRMREHVASGAIRRSMLDSILQVFDEGAQLLARNLGNAARLLADFGKISAAQGTWVRERFELWGLVGDIQRVLVHRYGQRVVFQLLPVGPDPDPVFLDSYPHLLTQILLEVCENAVQHGLAGGAGTVTLSCVFDGEQIALVIEDDGVGVPEADLARIFDPFFTTRMGDASGLGLSAVHNAVSGPLGGHVHAEQRPHGGTRICIDLPMQAPDPARAV